MTHLQQHGLLDSSLTSPSAQETLSGARAVLSASRLSLLQTALPLLKLPSAASQHGDRSLHRPIRALIARLLAQLRLPPHLRGEPPSLPSHLLDDASTALAQAAASDAEDLADAWNRLVPEQFAAEGAQLLMDRIGQVREEREHLQKEIRDLDVAIADTRETAVDMYAAAMRGALEATEEDLAERDGEGSMDAARVHMLVARGRATTAKLRLQRAEIAAMVYTDEAVVALKKVAAEVKKRSEDVERRIDDGEKKLARYRALGPEFEEVVAEYLKARQVLEEKVWSRDELKGR